MKKVAFLDIVHPVLEKGLIQLGFKCIDLSNTPIEIIISKISEYEGIVIRSRFPLDRVVLSKATKLKFIARSGAGLENIDLAFCKEKEIELFNAPEGNRNAVAEHALGMLLSLFNKLCSADIEVRKGIWKREGNRGVELDGKVVGIIGFGNTGRAFAKKLQGFDVTILAYDKYKTGFGDSAVKESTMVEIFQKADVLSLHIPQTEETHSLVDTEFISKFKKRFYLLNLSRGKIVNTEAVVKGLEDDKLLGVCLDVLEYEKSSFESLFSKENAMPESFKYLIKSKKVLFTPHVGGWTVESYFKLSSVLLKKVKNYYKL